MLKKQTIQTMPAPKIASPKPSSTTVQSPLLSPAASKSASSLGPQVSSSPSGRKFVNQKDWIQQAKQLTVAALTPNVNPGSFQPRDSEAGPESCTFYEDSVEAIEEELNGIYNSLIRAPIPLETNVSHGLVDYTLVHYTVLSKLYTSFKSWHELAKGLAGLAEGNGAGSYNLVAAPMFKCNCDSSVNDLAPVIKSVFV
ncbi:hypothetical protein PQX77_017299 [Marasmius sp. AFHP31]|nr:hypothetical protein PQX77_017299 [Marasmius sp. AFHP31]